MNVEIKIDPAYACPKVLIFTAKLTEEIATLMERLRIEDPKKLLGFRDDQVFLIDIAKIQTIYTENQKIYTRVENQVYLLKNRLYELEENLSGAHFQRISNSEIVNFEFVSHLDLSIGGTITLCFLNGNRSFVSRRYMSKIKQHLGL